MRISLSKILVLAAGLTLIPATVQAGPEPGYPVTTTPHCSVAAAYPGMTPFDFCWGAYAGNDNGHESSIAAMIAAHVGTGPWTWAGKTNAGAGEEGPFDPIDNGQTTGTLTFVTPVTSSFAILLKAANQFSIYYYAFPFDPADMPPLPDGVDFNTWGVNLPNRGGNVNALSHASLYLGPETVIPEPSTFILLGTGLLFLFGVERRRRKALGEN